MTITLIHNHPLAKISHLLVSLDVCFGFCLPSMTVPNFSGSFGEPNSILSQLRQQSHVLRGGGSLADLVPGSTKITLTAPDYLSG